MAGRGQVSWLPGIGRPHLPGGSVSPPVAGAYAPAASFAPVTVAGPRRLRTGLPLTTDRLRRRVYPAARPPARHLIFVYPTGNDVPRGWLSYYADNEPQANQGHSDLPRDRRGPLRGVGNRDRHWDDRCLRLLVPGDTHPPALSHVAGANPLLRRGIRHFPTYQVQEQSDPPSESSQGSLVRLCRL